MRAGETIRVRVNDEVREARVLRILDRRGREVEHVPTDDPPPFTTLVLQIAGFEAERVCLPLWVEDPGVQVTRLVA